MTALREDGLAIRPMRRSREDLELFAACFAKNSSARRFEALEWQYLENPTQQLFVDFAVAPSGGRLAAIYAAIPVRVRIDGRIAIGIQSVDTITDADFRGRGLFLELARRTYARAADDGARLVYGFPNGNSAHGFFERLAWTRLDPVPFLIRPLRSTYVLERLKLHRVARLIPNLPLITRRSARRDRDVEAITRFDESATRLWNVFARDVGIAVERDATYLNWRLRDKPGVAYTSEGIRQRGELVAFISYVVLDKHGGRIGYVMEALCAPGHERQLRRLLHRALANMLEDGADVALAWCLSQSPQFASYLRTGFVPFPERMRPIELHFGARGFGEHAGAGISDRRSWYVSYLDSDTT